MYVEHGHYSEILLGLKSMSIITVNEQEKKWNFCRELLFFLENENCNRFL